jgi:hypothetical protein
VAQFSLQDFADRTEVVYQESLARMRPWAGSGGVAKWKVQRHSG